MHYAICIYMPGLINAQFDVFRPDMYSRLRKFRGDYSYTGFISTQWTIMVMQYAFIGQD
jgi:hypothetical protein